MNRRIFLLPFLYILSLPRALAKEDNTIRIIFPVTFKDKKRMKKSFYEDKGSYKPMGDRCGY